MFGTAGTGGSAPGIAGALGAVSAGAGFAASAPVTGSGFFVRRAAMPSALAGSAPARDGGLSRQAAATSGTASREARRLTVSSLERQRMPMRRLSPTPGAARAWASGSAAATSVGQGSVGRARTWRGVAGPSGIASAAPVRGGALEFASRLGASNAGRGVRRETGATTDAAARGSGFSAASTSRGPQHTMSGGFLAPHVASMPGALSRSMLAGVSRSGSGAGRGEVAAALASRGHAGPPRTSGSLALARSLEIAVPASSPRALRAGAPLGARAATALAGATGLASLEVARSVRGQALGGMAGHVQTGSTGAGALASRLPAAPGMGVAPLQALAMGDGPASIASRSSASSMPSMSSMSSMPRSASVSPLGIARSMVGSLPVSGAGAMGGVANAAGEVARTVAEEAATQQVARLTEGRVADGLSPTSNAGGYSGGQAGGASAGWASAGGGVQRAVVGGGPAGESSAGGAAPVGGAAEDAQREALMQFAMSDEFEGRLMEFLEERLLGEIERRGGRYGGWFA